VYFRPAEDNSFSTCSIVICSPGYKWELDPHFCVASRLGSNVWSVLQRIFVPHVLSVFQDLNADTELAATNGETVKALTIFAHALRFFRNHALQELADQSQTRIVNEDVRWIITVPAIWKEPAKQFMRQAAYQVRSTSSLQIFLAA